MKCFYTGDYIASPDTDEPLSAPSYFLDVKQPTDSKYRVVVHGTQNASYTFSIRGYDTDGNGGSDIRLTGTTAEGSSQTYVINYSKVPGSDTSAALVVGDTTGDGVVDCSDLAIVKASFGTKTGQAGFDPRADLNGDGVVNVIDLATVSKQLPAGTKCQ